MLTPNAIHSRTSLARSDDPIAAAEEEIRRYLFAHHVIPVTVRTNRPLGNPLIVLLGIYAILALITGLGALWLNRVECDPMVMDRGLTGVCRDWSRSVDMNADSATRWSPPQSF